MSVAEIVLWRHGQTAYNREGRFQGQIDVPLDQLGLAQASAAAPYVAALRPDLVLTSDLSRASATADAVAPLVGLTPERDARLREADMGVFEGLTLDEVARRHPEEYAAWQRGEHRRGGETPAELADRALPAVLEAVADRVLIVTHGGTSRAIIGALLELPQPRWGSVGPLGNCHWSHLRIGRLGWQLVAHNAGVHAAPEERAGLDREREPSQDADAIEPASAA